jgi:hypothetical protein
MRHKLFRNVRNQIPSNIGQRISQEIVSLGCVQLPDKVGYRRDMEMLLVKYASRFNGNII